MKFTVYLLSDTKKYNKEEKTIINGFVVELYVGQSSRNAFQLTTAGPDLRIEASHSICTVRI